MGAPNVQCYVEQALHVGRVPGAKVVEQERRRGAELGVQVGSRVQQKARGHGYHHTTDQQERTIVGHEVQ